VALDFPSLRVIGSHTGWPWVEEMIAMAWKHENVYVDISGYHPRYLDKAIVDFMNTRGRNKTLFGTNGWAYDMILPAFEQLGLKEESKRLVLRENAMRVFNL
jgi:predicted TIM-barrel fold metal-dependent hydrolase